MSKSLLLSSPLLLLGLFGCAARAPVHPRALENNEYCARYLGEGQLDAAERHCDLGIQFSPDYADLYVNKGLIQLRRNQMPAAKESFIKALRLNQESAQAYNNLGYVYLQEQKFGQAHDMLQRALKVNPDYLEARFNLAFCFQQMKEKAKARKEYEIVLIINPNLADAYLNLGLISLEEGALEDAIKNFTAATERDTKYEEAWLNLGVAYNELGKYAEAREAFTSCLEVNSNNVPCRNNVMIVNRKLQLLDPTLREIRDSQLIENTAPALYKAARAYREKGLRSEEERSLKKCVKLDGKYPPCHYSLFLIFKEDRRDQEAQIACKNFLKFAAAEEFPNEVESCDKFLATSF